MELYLQECSSLKNLNARLFVSISLNNYMPLVNRKRKNIYPFCERNFKQLHALNKDVPAENEKRKNKTLKTFC